MARLSVLGRNPDIKDILLSMARIGTKTRQRVLSSRTGTESSSLYFTAELASSFSTLLTGLHLEMLNFITFSLLAKTLDKIDVRYRN